MDEPRELSSRIKNLPPVTHRAFDVLELAMVLAPILYLYVSPVLPAGSKWQAALLLLALPFTGRR